MSWKHAVFLGGAVLVLVACDRVVAPEPQVRDGSAVVIKTLTTSSDSTTVEEDPALDPLDDDCRSGYNVHTGRECDTSTDDGFSF